MVAVTITKPLADLRRRSALFRKGTDYLKQAQRAVYRPFLPSDSRRLHPPVLCNSVPKSGTHLLLQIAEGLPSAAHWGTFIASTPSLTLRERSERDHLSRIRALVPGEVAGAHIFFSQGRADTMAEHNVCHLFIYRDPRDIIVSEAHYLAEMNKWHRLHRIMKDMPDDEARILALIEGVPGIYPDVRSRYDRYSPWLAQSRVFSVRYEDLIGPRRDDQVEALIDHYLSCTAEAHDRGRLMDQAIAAIAPERSHTFRSGTSGRWRREFSKQTLARFDAVAGDLLERLGYEH